MAVGLAGSQGKILLIDTEGRRSLHYADDYSFFHYDWQPPFGPAQLGAVLREGEAQGFSVIIVDSMSDEHEGEGGLCDMANAEYDAQRSESKNSAAAWAKPKAAHKVNIVRWLRTTKCHVIFCCRADEKVRFERVEKNGRMTTVVVPVGWQPIAEKRLLYDVTTSLLFTPDAPGEPQPIKLYDKHRPFFPTGTKVTRQAGAALGQWAAGLSAEGATEAGTDIQEILAREGEEAAAKGGAALNVWIRSLNRSEKALVAETMGAELRAKANAADAAAEETVA